MWPPDRRLSSALDRSSASSAACLSGGARPCPAGCSSAASCCSSLMQHTGVRGLQRRPVGPGRSMRQCQVHCDHRCTLQVPARQAAGRRRGQQEAPASLWPVSVLVSALVVPMPAGVWLASTLWRACLCTSISLPCMHAQSRSSPVRTGRHLHAPLLASCHGCALPQLPCQELLLSGPSLVARKSNPGTAQGPPCQSQQAAQPAAPCLRRAACALCPCSK